MSSISTSGTKACKLGGNKHQGWEIEKGPKHLPSPWRQACSVEYRTQNPSSWSETWLGCFLKRQSSTARRNQERSGWRRAAGLKQRSESLSRALARKRRCFLGSRSRASRRHERKSWAKHHRAWGASVGWGHLSVWQGWCQRTQSPLHRALRVKRQGEI